MTADNSWLNEHFSIILANNKGQKYKKSIEPFAGSASWSLAAMEVGLAEEYLINDSNKILINTLQLMKDAPALIKNVYTLLTQKYEVSLSKRDFFLEIIESHNRATNPREKSLLLPFIINHSWGGILFYDIQLNIIYRESGFLEKANLSLEMFLSEVDRVSHLFNTNRVSFKSGDFVDMISLATGDDFIALNPPYPENEHVTCDHEGMYVELYSPQQLHQNLVQGIQFLEKGDMTYGFYNPKFNHYVLRHEESHQPLNYVRIFGYENCAFGIGLDQIYFTSQFSIPDDINIFQAKEILRNYEFTPEIALEQFKSHSKNCFTVLYRTFIQPEREREYQKIWLNAEYKSKL